MIGASVSGARLVASCGLGTWQQQRLVGDAEGTVRMPPAAVVVTASG